MTRQQMADNMVRSFGMENELTIEFFKAMEEGATTEELYNIYIESARIETQDISREEEEESHMMKWYEVIQELGGGEEVILYSTTREADARRWLEEAGNEDNDIYIMQWSDAIEDCYVLD